MFSDWGVVVSGAFVNIVSNSFSKLNVCETFTTVSGTDMKFSID